MEKVSSKLLEKFELTKRLSAEKGFKIFTPSRLYFRAEHQFIGASNDSRAKGVFRIWIRRKWLWIEFLPFYENREHKAFLEEQLCKGSTLKRKLNQRRHRPAMGRFTPAHKMVQASEHEEFDLCVPNIRLP